jgi:hypothetical protein
LIGFANGGSEAFVNTQINPISFPASMSIGVIGLAMLLFGRRRVESSFN